MKRLIIYHDEQSESELSEIRETGNKLKESSQPDIPVQRSAIKAKSIGQYKKKRAQLGANKSMEKDQTREFKQNIKRGSQPEENSDGQTQLQTTTQTFQEKIQDKNRTILAQQQKKSTEDNQKVKFARNSKLKEQIQFNNIFIVDNKLAKEQQELIIRDTKVYFPYKPYDVQIEYMRNVIEALEKKGNGLLESPTGTGKTLCLLASVCSFVEKEFKEKKIKHNIIYMSRTHSQLRQVQKELSKTCYRPNMAIFASREQLCLKESLDMLRGKEKIQACGKGIKLMKKLRKDIKSQQDPKVVQAACFFYQERQDVISIGKRKLANRLLDIQIMRDLGRQQQFCPYFYPMQTKDFTSLFIMPYNYLLDAYLLNSYKEIIENSIIIFDEAHNVSEAACEGRSLVLQTHNFDTALLELNKLLSKYVTPSLESVRSLYCKQIKILIRMIEDWKETFAAFIESIYTSGNDAKRESGRDEPELKVVNKEKTDIALFEMFCGSISDEKKREFSERKDLYRSMMISKLINPIEEFSSYGVALIEELKETPDGVFSNFQKVLIFALKVKALIAPKAYNMNEKTWLQEEFNHFRLYVNKNSSGINGVVNYTVGLRCLVPWLTFQDILRFRPRTILLTSGTLKPLKTWQKELRVQFSNQLVNKHVINKEQIQARVIKAGASKVKFTFTFDNLSRNKVEIFKDLIEFLIQVSGKIPNGILLVFPSFKVQNDFKMELMRSNKKQRLQQQKEIIFQEKNTDLSMADFKRKALSSKGAILAIICRGKVSQGIDFPDGMCRAVILIGVPYPNIKDPFIIEKKTHLQNIVSRSSNKREAISGEQWYFMGTVRAINQALGRVIRHALDYGMIFLIDTRYCDNKMQKELPEWITQSIKVVETLQPELYHEVEHFYQRMKKKYYPPQAQKQKNEEVASKQTENNVFKLLMGNRKKHNKKIPNQAFDF